MSTNVTIAPERVDETVVVGGYIWKRVRYRWRVSYWAGPHLPVFGTPPKPYFRIPLPFGEGHIMAVSLNSVELDRDELEVSDGKLVVPNNIEGNVVLEVILEQVNLWA